MGQAVEPHLDEEMKIEAKQRLVAKITKAALTAKRAELHAAVTAMESQKHNPTVAPSYYRKLGVLEAIDAVLSQNAHELDML